MLTLTLDDFEYNDDETKLLLKKEGIVLVLFKMETCMHSKHFQQIFEKLDSSLSPIICATCNDSKIFAISRHTNTCICAVPTMILYVNGQPRAMLNSTRNVEELYSYLLLTLSHIPEFQQLNRADPEHIVFV